MISPLDFQIGLLQVILFNFQEQPLQSPCKVMHKGYGTHFSCWEAVLKKRRNNFGIHQEIYP